MRAGSDAIPVANGTGQLLLQRGPWMELAPLVGHVVPRALVQQQDGGSGLPLSPLQDSDDVQRINSMIEVRASLLLALAANTYAE